MNVPSKQIRSDGGGEAREAVMLRAAPRATSKAALQGRAGAGASKVHAIALPDMQRRRAG